MLGVTAHRPHMSLSVYEKAEHMQTQCPGILRGEKQELPPRHRECQGQPECSIGHVLQVIFRRIQRVLWAFARLGEFRYRLRRVRKRFSACEHLIK